MSLRTTGLVVAASLVVAATALHHPVHAQSVLDPPTADLVGEGWRGFADIGFMWNAFLTLVLATSLGAVIAYHPWSRKAVDTIEDVEAPKIFLTYSVVGAIIGVMVLKFGVVVGFVVFGIGGLIRFRTDLGSATKTGRLIFVTLVGLSCGLNLPHFAVLATAFGFGLIFLLDARMTFRIDVKDLDEEELATAGTVYARVLEENDCRVLATKRAVSKGAVTVIFRAPHEVTRESLEIIFERDIPRSLRSVVDWEIT